jgi:hypothetical protein
VARRTETSEDESVSEASATKEDPKGTLSYRLARAAVIILGVLLVIAIVTLVVGLILKLGHKASETETGPSLTKYTLPSGAHIVSMDAQPGRLILHVRAPAGDEIDIIDTESGRLVAQVKAPSDEGHQ